MNEEALAARLRENLPSQPEEETTKVDEKKPEVTEDTLLSTKIDDITQLKIHEYFGQKYRTSDEESKQRTSYIFETVAKDIGTIEYSKVISRIHEIEQFVGTTRSDNRLYKLYEWLKLDNTRRRASMEMDALRE